VTIKSPRVRRTSSEIIRFFYNIRCCPEVRGLGRVWGEFLHFGEKEDNEMPPHFFQKGKNGHEGDLFENSEDDSKVLDRNHIFFYGLREAVYFSAKWRIRSWVIWYRINSPITSTCSGLWPPNSSDLNSLYYMWAVPISPGIRVPGDHNRTGRRPRAFISVMIRN